MTAAVGHVAARPGWRCRTCAMPWPCAGARSELLTEFRDCPSALHIHLMVSYLAALDDLAVRGAVPMRELYERFLAWPRRSTVAPPP